MTERDGQEPESAEPPPMKVESAVEYCGHPTPDWEGQAMKCAHVVPCPRHAPTAKEFVAAFMREVPQGSEEGGLVARVEARDKAMRAGGRQEQADSIERLEEYIAERILYTPEEIAAIRAEGRRAGYLAGLEWAARDVARQPTAEIAVRSISAEQARVELGEPVAKEKP